MCSFFTDFQKGESSFRTNVLKNNIFVSWITDCSAAGEMVMCVNPEKVCDHPSAKAIILLFSFSRQTNFWTTTMGSTENDKS